MRLTVTKPVALLFGLSLGILAGCVNLGSGTTDTTRLYVLAAMPADEAADRGGYDGDSILGVGPLVFPEYLNRPQVVTRIGENEIKTASFANWAEPLHRNFQRVLIENLSVLLGTDAVYSHPWRSTLKPDHRIELEVIRFDAAPRGDAVLVVRWEVTGERGKQVRAKEKAVYRQAVAADDHAAIVIAMSRALADLSRDMAAAITDLDTKTPQK